jgi:hypothetical protein
MAPKRKAEDALYVPRTELCIDTSNFESRAWKCCHTMIEILQKYLPLHDKVKKAAQVKQISTLIDALTKMNSSTEYTEYTFNFVQVEPSNFIKVLDCIDKETSRDGIVESEVMNDRLRFSRCVQEMGYCLAESCDQGGYKKWRKALLSL